MFELLALSGMLMDYNWTEILKRKELYRYILQFAFTLSINFDEHWTEACGFFFLSYREAFSGFDPEIVAKMGDKEINEISSNKAIILAESRVRCIIDNAKCIVKASFKMEMTLQQS